MKFAHIADTHIRNLKYHQEYRAVFDKIYDSLRKEEVDYIVHCGDICHTKTQISPEFVQMCSDFFKNLASIAPTYIILGNHDGNLRNPNRQDSISPIVNALNSPNLHLLKNSGEVHLNNNFTLNVMSVFDEDNWIDPSNPNKINIALYHGSISGCKTDIGWTMDVGEHDADIFNKVDYAMLGDIHLTNQTMDDKKRIRYAGSTIQQNHGEEANKGFLIWDIQSKESFTVKPVAFANPKPFISVSLTKEGKIPDACYISQNARLRLVAENSVTPTALKKAIDVAKKRFKPESISTINKSKFANNVEIEDGFKKENLRDIAIQEKLIRQYLEDYNPSKDLEKRITDLNKKYKQIIEETDETYRNVDYEILEFEWSNLINYGEDNRIDFTNLGGIVGIFGRNFSGKSSIIDSLLFTIYNSISKNSRKNLNIINNDKTDGYGQVKIRRGSKVFTIKRQSSKYLKKLKGEETVEAKTVVDFSCVNSLGEEQSLNGLTRADTDRNIVKYFGTMDDFLITSMSSQLGALSFIDEGSTKRKEILAKFLDLQIFDKKFKVAKEDAAELKAAIRLLETVDYDEELKRNNNELLINDAAALKRKNQCENLKATVKITQEEIAELENKINAAPTEIIDIVNIYKSIAENEQELLTIDSELATKKSGNKKNKRHVRKAKEFIENFDIDALKAKQESFNVQASEIDKVLTDLKAREEQLAQAQKQVELLEEVPCGSEFSHCKFIHGAYKAKDEIDLIQLSIKNNATVRDAIQKSMESTNITELLSEGVKYDEKVKEKENLESDISTQGLLIENLKSKKSITKHELKELQAKEKLYEENKEVIEDLGGVIRQKKAKQKELTSQNDELSHCEDQLLNLHKSHGYYEQKIENLKIEKGKFEKHRNDYEVHDLYAKCMHPSGIAYDIIKKSLPTINSEISKILANIVDFQVYFETDDNRLDIYIQQPDQDASPLEMASGAEKTVAAMAIRLAFTNISSLPKSQLFILDEPGTSLDAERMEGFVRILDITSSIFKTVILISHLDSLKDTADSIISIEKKDGFANVRT